MQEHSQDRERIKAWLQLEARPDKEHNGHAIFHQTAFFEPHGLGGFLYWYLLYPLHTIIFVDKIRAFHRIICGQREIVEAEQVLVRGKFDEQ